MGQRDAVYNARNRRRKVEMKSVLTSSVLCASLGLITFGSIGCGPAPVVPSIKPGVHDAHGGAKVTEEAEKYKGGRPKPKGPGPVGGHQAK